MSSLFYFFKESLQGFARNLSTTLGSIITIFLSLLIIGVFLVGGTIVERLVSSIEDEVSITAYVADDAPQESIDAVTAMIQGMDGVESVGFTTKEQALENFSNSMTTNPEIIEQLDGTNPLPASIDVSLADPQKVDEIAAAIEADETFRSICDEPDNPADSLKYGQKTVDRLFSVTKYVRYLGVALVLLLVFIALVFINNTIRLAIMARRKEIAIMRLVGASNGFIRGPFLMEGALHALIGSLLAVGVLQVLRMYGIPKLQSALSFLSLDVSGNTYIMIYIVLVVLFAYFYTSITFNPLEVANNMKKSGGFIPGVRPGKPTSDFLNNILNYIVFIGATGLVIVCIVPIIASGLFNVGSLSFGGTSLIIIAGVILETIKAVDSMMLVRNYKGFLND